ncbi:hypothetical protein SDRG_05552 [Saprolegnia diclina VS20]|uniref:START domain-containing protein n=1 Tax=Saprolegnia diclina (strain VS20) TaxID=1156394 RepID=T0QH93_SAPDV|nr:hypothetical protein SDRG_05552 [Saprolegnia diclina VS20]EQC37334.1 hypothetical protein SDRG_05552 [Saprolegnia diclina VS20]|eukprot:XP_008609496.1 hypothetical protein SDRG_05552 [Saprolegnia diclina VS20]
MDMSAGLDAMDAAIMESLMDEGRPSEHYQKRQKVEMAALRTQVASLSATLALLVEAKRLQVQRSTDGWEKVARRQKLEVESALFDSTRLRRAVHEQRQLIATLERLLVKHRRAVPPERLPLESWQLRCMPRETQKRAETLHALLDDSFRSREAMDIRTQLFEHPIGHRHLSITSETSDVAAVTYVSTTFVAADYEALSEAIWSNWNVACHASCGTSAETACEDFGPDSVYCHLETGFVEATPTLFALAGLKRYVEPGRVTIVLKTMLSDERHPTPPHLILVNETQSIVVEPVKGGALRHIAVEGRYPLELPPSSALCALNLPAIDAIAFVVENGFRTLEDKTSSLTL